MEYEVRYTRNDGSFGAYSGDKDGKDAFLAEINYCLNAGWEFTATVKREREG